MDAVVLSLAVVVLAAFVAAPLYGRPAGAAAPRPDVGSDARRRAVEAALADLETDLASGLIDRPSYDRERGRLQAPGASAD